MRAIAMAAMLLVSLLLAGQACAAPASVRIGTWNLERLGDGDKKDYASIAAVAAHVDLLAIQEVMTAQGLDNLKAALERQTHETWSVQASSPVGTAHYKEMYAMVYRNSAVEYVEGAASYLDRKNVFAREPFSARFRAKAGGEEFALGTVHVLYGKSAKDRAPELAELANYWTWLEEIYPGVPVILVGDFNMNEANPAFDALRAHAVPLVTAGASTLSAKDGAFANLYDNVWVSPKDRPGVTAVGVVNYPLMLHLSHAQARATVSDHAPVFVQLGQARLDKAVIMTETPRPPAANDAAYAPAASGPVRGNRSSHVYHRPQGCPSYNRFSAQNRVEFASEAEAKAQGYHLAGNCK